MNWETWLEYNQYDLDFGNDTVDLMKETYVAGLQQAFDLIDVNEDGDLDFIRYRLKQLIKESK